MFLRSSFRGETKGDFGIFSIGIVFYLSIVMQDAKFLDHFPYISEYIRSRLVSLVKANKKK